MVSDDPRIFKPEVEQDEFLRRVNQGILRPDGTRTDGPPAGASSGPGGGGFRVAMVFVPFIALLVAAFIWIGGIAGLAPRFRKVLTALLPEAWVATSPDGVGNALAVGLTLGAASLLVLIGLFVARRATVRRWAQVRGVVAVLAGLAVFAISAVIVLVCIMIPGVVLVGTAIATGADLGSAPLPDGATVRSWPLVLTAIATAWFALGATRRAARKRGAYRLSFGGHDPSGSASSPTGPW